MKNKYKQQENKSNSNNAIRSLENYSKAILFRSSEFSLVRGESEGRGREVVHGVLGRKVVGAGEPSDLNNLGGLTCHRGDGGSAFV